MKKLYIILITCYYSLSNAQEAPKDSVKKLEEVVVAASRIEESIFSAPVSVGKINATMIQRTASTEMIALLASQKGIDVSRSSWFVSSLSSRGFNSAKAERLLQLSDNVEFMSPTSSLYGGNWMGTSELDIESIEIIYGANSALYGSGALNGVILMNSKNPFFSQGLTMSMRSGTRHLADFQMRYAKAIVPKVAIKWNINYTSADEFTGNSDAAIKPKTEGGLAGSDALNNGYASVFGWNKLNFFGDLGQTVSNPIFTQYNNGQAYRVYMPGFKESDLLAANRGSFFNIFGSTFKAGHLKINPSIHLRLSPKTQAMYEYKFSLGNGIFQSTSRFAWREMKYDMHKIELKNDSWFVRAYSLFDYGGKAYELGGVANALQNIRLTNPENGQYPTYATNYLNAWNQIFASARGDGFVGGMMPGVYSPDFEKGGIPSNWSIPQIVGNQSIEEAAKLAFDLTKNLQINPSQALFQKITNQVADGVGDLQINGSKIKGAAFANTARNVDFSAQKTFSWKSSDLIIGGAWRKYYLKSSGTLLSDGSNSPLGAMPRNYITNWESGIYSQLRYKFINDKLLISVASRMDNFKNFGLKWSPRISAVYSEGRHNFRANFATAYRAPAQLDQYIYLDYGSILLIGNTENGFKGLNASGTLPIAIPKIAPEQMNSWEIGYKALINKDLQIDMSYYRSLYNQFIGIVRFQGREDGLMPEGNFQTKTGDWAKPITDRTRGRFIQTWANFDKPVTTQGAFVSLDYRLNKFFSFYGNYTWSKISTIEGLIAGFNTPTHKFNVGLNGTCSNKLFYSLNYRWNSTYTYFMPFDEGEIKAFGTLDAQLNYSFATHTTLKCGATNLTNAYAVSVYGSAPIPRLVYFGVVLNLP